MSSSNHPFRTAIDSLEPRQLFTIVGSDIRTLSASDGTKNNGQDVIIRFNTPIQSVDASKIRAFGYSNNTILGGQVKSTINVQSATVSGSTIVIRTDVQVRKGAQFNLQTGAVTDATGAGQTGIIKLTKGLNRDRFTLALRAFKPRDKTLFNRDFISGGINAQTANSTPSESSQLSGLTSFLAKKVSAGIITQAKADTAIAGFNSSTNKGFIPAPNLRAAIASLVGTVAESAIDYFFGTDNSTGKLPLVLNFDGTQFSSGAKIAETSYTSTNRLKVIFNPNYAGESFVVLSGLLAHEVCFDGRGAINSEQKETISYFIENTVYAQQVVNDFTYSRRPTVLTTRANYHLLTLLNSGDRQFPRVGILKAPLVGNGVAAPGFTPEYGTGAYTDFQDLVTKEFTERMVAKKPDIDTRAPALKILNAITGNTYTTATAKYGTNLIRDIDISQDTLSDSYVMRVARVLQVSV